MSITKSTLIKTICQKLDLSKGDSKIAVETLLETIKRTLESGENVMITGFGKFCVKDKKDRKGRNPQTGDGMILDARRVVTFKCSGMLREKMNGKR